MQPASIDAETKVAQDPGDHKAELRLWLRLLTCTRLIENEVRRKLRRDFDFTLSRFDLLAQLDKASDGMVLGEVSKRLMVSPGNVTSLVERSDRERAYFAISLRTRRPHADHSPDRQGAQGIPPHGARPWRLDRRDVSRSLAVRDR